MKPEVYGTRLIDTSGKRKFDMEADIICDRVGSSLSFEIRSSVKIFF